LEQQIEPADGAGVRKHRLTAKAPRAAAGVSDFGGLLSFFSGNLPRRTLLFVVIPIIFLSYFGTLAFAILWSQKTYDWRYSVISHLISPRNNPEFHAIPSLGIATTGLLIIPFAGYINRRLRVASRLGANIGSVAFANGAIWLILAGLIVSRSHHGTSSLPRLHEMCARTAALGIGTGLLAFCSCALKGYFIPAKGKKLYQRRLMISWILLTFGPVGRHCFQRMFITNNAGSLAMVTPNRSDFEKLALLASSFLGMDWLSSGVSFPAECGCLFTRANFAGACLRPHTHSYIDGNSNSGFRISGVSAKA
jgi:hypothetical protein